MSTVITPDGAIADPYRNFIALSRYARWLEDENRRETWSETVDRYVEFFRKHLSAKHGYSPTDTVFEEVRDAILHHKVMPSMRAIMTAGAALERSNIAGYNCSFVAVDHPRAFDEALYILLNGTGVGFSVEARHVEKLPPVPDYIEPYDHDGNGAFHIVVEDSKEGWASAFQTLLSMLWKGVDPTWDMSKVRPAGSRLKTFGGRASGPGPLDALFRFTRDTFLKAMGRRLSPLECHDLMCKIGDIVVVGGVRRSALISLSDLSDYDMATAKSGAWWEEDGHRRLANNSAVYTHKPSASQFLAEWKALIDSNSGERGIFNLEGARKHAARFGNRDHAKIEGTNPCGEILLRSKGFCNLTEVVIEADDTEADVLHKVRLASIMGTWQASLTDFPYLRPEWSQNAQEEALLGVSLTGIYGNVLFNDHQDDDLPRLLTNLREHARRVNRGESIRIGIEAAAAITCVKPSGTVSQLTGVSSGIHPWYSQYYIRTVRGSNNDPLTKMMRDYGFPSEPDVMNPEQTTVFSFPIAAPASGIVADDLTAIQQLELWAIYRTYWTEHNPSITVYVGADEWLEVGNWVYVNWDKVGGITFLPRSEHVYVQAPYQPVSQVDHLIALNAMPKNVRWSDLSFYETEDATTGSRELACAADGTGCDVVDIGDVAAVA